MKLSPESEANMKVILSYSLMESEV